MKSLNIFCIVIFVVFIACKKNPPDGDYCAKVSFNKPGLKRLTSLKVIVSIKKNQLIDIHFPTDHYDQSDVKPIIIPEDGRFNAVSQSGTVYKIEMKGTPDKCLEEVTRSNDSKKIQCKSKNNSGKRCQRMTDNKNGYCWQHGVR